MRKLRKKPVPASLLSILTAISTFNVGEAKVTIRIGRSRDQLSTLTREMGCSVSDAAALLGGVVWHEVVVVERGGIWYLFDDRSFKAGVDDVPLRDNDVVFHLPQNTTYDQLASQHISYMSGVDAVDALKEKSMSHKDDPPKAIVSPTAASRPQRKPESGEKAGDLAIVASRPVRESVVAAVSPPTDERQSPERPIWIVVGGAVLVGLLSYVWRGMRGDFSKR